MDRCWASVLGQCSSKMSNEHLVSKSLFDGGVVKVQGFPWCRDSPKTIGLASLTAKVLCKAHNETISDVDTAGASAFKAFRAMTLTRNQRKKMQRGSWTVKKYGIDGPLLERWFLTQLSQLNPISGQN